MISDNELQLEKENYRLSFRAIDDADIKPLEAIQKECYTQPWDSSVIEQVIDDNPNMHGRVLELQPVVHHFIAKEDEPIVVGSCLFQKFTEKVYIADMTLSPNHQGKGLGKFMMDKMKGMLNKDKRHSLIMMMNERNVDALNFLKSQEFLSVELHKDLFEGSDGIEMVYDIRRTVEV